MDQLLHLLTQQHKKANGKEKETKEAVIFER